MEKASFGSIPADPDRIAVARALLHLYSVFCVIAAVVDAFTGKPFMAVVAISSAVLIQTVFAVARLKRRPAWVLYFTVWLHVGNVVLGSVAQTSTPEVSVWGIVYPFMFYHLAGLRTGTLLCVFGAVVMPISYLGSSLAGTPAMSVNAFTQFEMAFIFSAFLAFLYERIRTRQAEALIKDQRELESLVEKRTAESVALYRRLDSVREEQAAKVGQELHDELGGVFIGLKFNHAQIARHLRDTGADHAILAAHDQSLALIQDGLDAQRRIVNELRPPLLDDLGIASAIEWQAGEFSHRTGLACEVSLYDRDARLGSEASLALYRILQEALTNVAKHAKATRVSIELKRAGDEVTLGVRDNGIGLPPSASAKKRAGSHGLRGMEERIRHFGGTVSVTGHPGQGTYIEATLPV